MNSARQTVGMLLVASLLAACSEQVTQVIVFVDAEGPLREDADHLRIRVQGRDALDDTSRVDKVDETLTGKINWPVKLALAPAGGDAERVFWIEASALDGRVVLATARLLSGYVKGETRYARLLIEDACRSVTCAQVDDTCHDGQCVDAFRAPDELGKTPKGPTDIQAPDGGFSDRERDASGPGPTRDGGSGDADTQADEDGGTDAAMPPQCTTNVDCEPTTPVCALGKCVECALDQDCADAKRPFCSASGSCSGCVSNAQCPSGACETSGECSAVDRIVYLTPGNGSSASDCGTQLKPCGFTPDAIAHLSPQRPVLLITKGTYTGQQFVFTAGIAMRIIADGVTLNLLGGAPGPVITVKDGATVTLEGITVRGASTSGNEEGDGIQCQSSTLNLQRVIVADNVRRGISADACTFSLLDSRIEGNGDYGVQVIRGQGVIERSLIADNLQGGISLFDPSPMRIANNLIKGNSSTSNYDGAIRSSGAMGTSTVIAFNTITGNKVNQNYIGIVACAADFVVDSNIVWGNIVEPSDSQDNRAQTFMNCTVTNSITELAATVGSSSTFFNMVTSNPRFIDAASGVFGLMADSPALDRGTAAYAGLRDQAGNPRTVANGPDLGCYER